MTNSLLIPSESPGHRVSGVLFLFLINTMYRRGHVEHALRQFHTAAGALVDDLVEQLQNEIVRVPGLQHLQLANIQITPAVSASSFKR